MSRLMRRKFDADLAKLVKHEFRELSEDDLRKLSQRGYNLIKELGNGNTRIAYLSEFSSGDDVTRYRVLKVPRSEIGTSVCTLINLEKRDPNKREVDISNGL